MALASAAVTLVGVVLIAQSAHPRIATTTDSAIPLELVLVPLAGLGWTARSVSPTIGAIRVASVRGIPLSL